LVRSQLILSRLLARLLQIPSLLSVRCWRLPLRPSDQSLLLALRRLAFLACLALHLRRSGL